MSGQVLSIAPGSRLSFDGDVVEVVAVDGVRVTVRNDRTRQFTAVQISRLAASARPVGPFGPVMTACHPGSRSAARRVSPWTSSRNGPGTCVRS